MNVVLQWRGNRFMVVVTKAVLSHNHVLSHTVYKQYAAVRVAGDDALTANGPATQHDDELQTPEADHSVSSPVTATPTASSTTMTMTTAGSSFVAEATTASPNVVVESRRVPGPRPIECFVLSFEREWEPILSLWAKDALTFSHDRMLAAVDQTLTPVVASQQKEGGPARVPVFVDVGCATGALSLAFADKFDASRGHSVLDGSVSEAERSLRHARIIATDIADGMLDRITDKLNAYPTSQSLQARVTTVQMDGQLLDKLEDGSVDIVGSNFGLSIFPDRVKSWRSAARVLRDGGLLFATAWDAQTAIIRWMDGCVQLARRSSLSRGSAQFAEREEHRSVALPSAMMGFEMVVGELEASGFADVEVFRTRHSVVFSSPRALVDSMLASPELAGFLDRIPRERLADYLYGALVKEGTFTINSRQGDESQLSFEDVKWSSRPVTVDFVANIFVASRSRRAAAHPTSGTVVGSDSQAPESQSHFAGEYGYTSTDSRKQPSDSENVYILSSSSTISCSPRPPCCCFSSFLPPLRNSPPADAATTTSASSNQPTSMASHINKLFTNETWSKMADDYERVTESFVARWADDALRIAHKRMLAVTSTHQTASPPLFVDVGCGTGALSFAFAEKCFTPSTEDGLHGVRILATDIADGMIDRITDKLNNRPTFQPFRSRITTVQMDGQLLDKLADGSADIIGSNFGLSIFPDRVKAWSSAARVLRDGGLLFATVWDVQSPNLQWADVSAAVSREVQLAKAATCASDSTKVSSNEAPQAPFVPSLRAGHGNIVNELQAVGFRDVEIHCTRHSIEASSSFVHSLLSNPVFIARVGQESHAEFLKRVAMNGDAAIATAIAAVSGAATEPPTCPLMIEFVAHIVVATR
ncbi:hypothetical protein PybrP1_013085 [[Pythium] brassicae (nom. inval.)]|nr:hypothetical protein PybrP1_013085 [[Pythium] brassicae (nom. inval.)]